MPRTSVIPSNEVADSTEIHDAARVAGIHERIMELPGQYSHRVGNTGARLSDGEKQRLAIARAALAALRKPQIILFDESSSGLDAITEVNIRANLQNIFNDTTKIVVTHRLDTIIDADLIYYVEGGEIVDKGTHDELIKKDGVYKKMWDAYSNKRTSFDNKSKTG